jgi:hypothetical protein
MDELRPTEGMLQKEVLCSVVESMAVVDLRKSCRLSMTVKVTTHVRIVVRSRMREAVPFVFIEWR